jgi:hypothetical protein
VRNPLCLQVVYLIRAVKLVLCAPRARCIRRLNQTPHRAHVSASHPARPAGPRHGPGGGARRRAPSRGALCTAAGGDARQPRHTHSPAARAHILAQAAVRVWEFVLCITVTVTSMVTSGPQAPATVHPAHAILYSAYEYVRNSLRSILVGRT